MHRRPIAHLGTVLTLACLALMGSLTPAMAADARLDTATIERLTGVKGELSEKEGVFKVSVPRSDLDVTAAGVKMTPALGLTSWAAFQKAGDHVMAMGDMVLLEDQVNPVMSVALDNGLTSWAAFQRAGDHVMVMGDMVLLEDQVNPVMSAALDNGLAVTALHNHFFWDAPKVMFMHIGGMGDEATLAGAVGKVFGMIKDTSGGKGEVPRVELSPAQTSLDPRAIEEVLGVKGQLANGVYKVTLGRTTKMDGHEVGNTMGVNTWAAFAGSDANAVVDGDFVMFEPEVQPVLKALRGAGINIVAIHNHMIEESPRTVFLHYWGVGPTRDLAQGLKAALAIQGR